MLGRGTFVRCRASTVRRLCCTGILAVGSVKFGGALRWVCCTKKSRINIVSSWIIADGIMICRGDSMDRLGFLAVQVTTKNSGESLFL